MKRKEFVHAIHLTKSNLMVEIEDYGQERPLPSFKQNRPGSDYFNSNWSMRNMNIINPTQKGQSKVYLYDEETGGKGANEVCSIRWHNMKFPVLGASITSSVVANFMAPGEQK